MGGDGLATGYLGCEELNRERFLHLSLPEADEQRVYRTGDLGRYLPDGNIEFLGRQDHQIKLRGIRIELGEIEAALSAHPTVGQRVVVLREDKPADPKIVAYLVASQGEPLTGAAWRDVLCPVLPDVMIPSAFVYLDMLPLTPNGKVDRAALPEPALERSDDAIGHMAPRTATEQQIAESWQRLLGVDGIGVHDDFFHLGGHSLMAVQAINRIRDVMQIEIPVTSIFELPTIALLAQRIEAMQFAALAQDKTLDDSDMEVLEL